MQFKRDTDYAIRILYCLHQSHRIGDTAAKGLSLTEIARQTGTPKIVAGRVCEKLKAKGIICLIRRQTVAEKTYDAAGELLDRSLLEVVEAVEGPCRLFAVFNTKSAVYQACEERMQKIQKRIQRILANATLGSLFE